LIGSDDHHAARRRAGGRASRTPLLDSKSEHVGPEPYAARLLAKSIVERAATTSAAVGVAMSTVAMAHAADRALER
jgi:hypothetical protein